MDAAAPLASEGAGLGAGTAQTQILDFFFPGFSGTSKFEVSLWSLLERPVTREVKEMADMGGQFSQPRSASISMSI